MRLIPYYDQLDDYVSQVGTIDPVLAYRRWRAMGHFMEHGLNTADNLGFSDFEKGVYASYLQDINRRVELDKSKGITNEAFLASLSPLIDDDRRVWVTEVKELEASAANRNPDLVRPWLRERELGEDVSWYDQALANVKALASRAKNTFTGAVSSVTESPARAVKTMFIALGGFILLAAIFIIRSRRP